MNPPLRCRFAFQAKTGLINRGARSCINDRAINPNKARSLSPVLQIIECCASLHFNIGVGETGRILILARKTIDFTYCSAFYLGTDESAEPANLDGAIPRVIEINALAGRNTHRLYYSR